MSTTVEPTVQWSQDQMVEVLLNEPDDFLKVRETLTRIGVASRKEKKLYQSCHILHKRGENFIQPQVVPPLHRYQVTEPPVNLAINSGKNKTKV